MILDPLLPHPSGEVCLGVLIVLFSGQSGVPCSVFGFLLQWGIL